MRRKNCGFPALVLTVALLAGCGASAGGGSSAASSAAGGGSSAPAGPAASGEEPAAQANALAITDREGTPADFAAWETAMSPEAYADLADWLPILEGAETLCWAARPDREEEPDYSGLQHVTLAALHGAIWDGYEEAPDTLVMNCLSVQDLDGDGAAELCLLTEEFGWFYLIFHREGDAVYVTDVSIRAFEGLQTNGVYFGSGGAGDATYYRMRFENGAFEQRELAHKSVWASGASGVSYTLDGQDVTEAAFDAWLAENQPGEAVWYSPDGAAHTGIAA